MSPVSVDSNFPATMRVEQSFFLSLETFERIQHQPPPPLPTAHTHTRRHTGVVFTTDFLRR